MTSVFTSPWLGRGARLFVLENFFSWLAFMDGS